MRELESLLDRDAMVTTDAGNFAGWATRFINFRDGQRYIGPTNGAMGYSVPAAIGAKIAYPGSHGGEHGRRRRLPDDRAGDSPPRSITASRRSCWCSTTRCTARSACTRSAPIPAASPAPALTNPDFAKFIEAFGGHGEVVSDTAEFAPAFRRAVDSGKPAVIELRMNPEQITTRATIADLRAGRAAKPAAKPKRAAAPRSSRSRRAVRRPARSEVDEPRIQPALQHRCVRPGNRGLAGRADAVGSAAYQRAMRRRRSAPAWR